MASELVMLRAYKRVSKMAHWSARQADVRRGSHNGADGVRGNVTACNLRCPYCYLHNCNGAQQARMTAQARHVEGYPWIQHCNSKTDETANVGALAVYHVRGNQSPPRKTLASCPERTIQLYYVCIGSFWYMNLRV